jgi:zinc protease
VGPLLVLHAGCGTPGASGGPALGNATLPAPRASRESRAAFELPNGVRVVLEESHVTPTVAIQAWVRGGAADQRGEGEAGAAHLVERLVVGSVEGPPAVAWSGHDATVFEALVAPSQVSAGLGALGAALARRTFEAADVERARADVVAESRRAATDPATRTSRALFLAAFGATGYGQPLVGAEGLVAALTREQVARFHERAYVAPNVTLVVVGDFEARAVRAAVASAFGAIPRGAPAVAPAASAPAAPRVQVVSDVSRDSRLAVGFRLPPFADADLAAVDLLAAVLARGGADSEGRLPRELARNRQLASTARSTVFAGREAGLLSLEARLVAGRADEAAAVVLDEALRLARQEVSASELDAARAALETDLVRGKESTSGYARRLGYFATVAGDADYEDRYLARLRKLDPADLRAVAARVLRAENASLAALTPEPSDGGAGIDAALAERLGRVVAAAEARADARRVVAPVAGVSAVDDVVRVVLPSGTRLLVLRDPAVHAVWVQALWPGGLRLEDARSNGVTSLLAATLTRGTRTRPATRVAADARALGGALSATAGVDDMGLAGRFLSRHWESALELVADCVQSPAFPEAEVDVAMRAQLARARVAADDASDVARRLFAETLFPRHPYRRALLGTAETISTLSRRRVAEHFRRSYGAANLTLAIVGDVDVERVVAKARVLFSDARAAAEPAPPPAEERAPEGPAEVFRAAPKDAAYAIVGYPGLSLRDPDRAAAAVLARLLSGPEGRLARETAGAVVAEASSTSALEGGAFTVGVPAAPERLDAAVIAVRAALANVAQAGFTAAEVAVAQRDVLRARVAEGEHRAATAAALARGEALGLGAGALRGAPAGLGALTPDAVTRVARRLLDPAREIVAVARPAAPPAVSKALPPRTAARPAQPSGGGRASAP